MKRYYIFISFLFLTAALMGQEHGSDAELREATSPVFPYWTDSPEMSIRNPGFQGSVDIGSIPPGNGLDSGGLYQRFIFSVQYNIKKFRVGLRIPVSFRVGLSNTPTFDFNTSEWIPTGIYHGLELYLSMLDITYGHPDEPIYLQFGTLKGVRLGNGGIVDRYTNGLYLPAIALPGLAFTLDPVVWDFPYVGIQGLFGNLGNLDLMGGRVFVRPLASLKGTAARLMEVGGTFVVDRAPFYDGTLAQRQAGDSLGDALTVDDLTTAFQISPTSSAMLIGGDIRVPLTAKKMFSMDLHADYIYQNKNHGARLGVDMRIIRILYLSMTTAYTQKNVQFGYVDENYDTIRSNRYLTYAGKVEKPEGIDWTAHVGIFLFDEKIGFEVHSGGPLYTVAPFSLRAQFSMYEGLIPVLKGLSMAIYYEKQAFDSFDDFAELSASTIGGEISLRVAPVVLRCNVKVLNSTFSEDGWKLASDIGVSVSF